MKLCSTHGGDNQLDCGYEQVIFDGRSPFAQILWRVVEPIVGSGPVSFIHLHSSEVPSWYLHSLHFVIDSYWSHPCAHQMSWRPVDRFSHEARLSRSNELVVVRTASSFDRFSGSGQVHDSLFCATLRPSHWSDTFSPCQLCELHLRFSFQALSSALGQNLIVALWCHYSSLWRTDSLALLEFLH